LKIIKEKIYAFEKLIILFWRTRKFTLKQF